MDGLLTLLMAGGKGNRLQPLTARWAKPAIPFAGRRLIDFTLRNYCVSGIRSVSVLVQYRAGSVASHLDTRRHRLGVRAPACAASWWSPARGSRPTRSSGGGRATPATA